MSRLSIQRGVNSLFFPGGTRSRDGAIETDLKMGLLGTVVEAQRAMVAKKTEQECAQNNAAHHVTSQQMSSCSTGHLL